MFRRIVDIWPGLLGTRQLTLNLGPEQTEEEQAQPLLEPDEPDG